MSPSARTCTPSDGVSTSTFGIGGELGDLARAPGGPVDFTVVASGSNVSYPGVTSQLTSLAPQGSLNFGSGAGWSYLSVGVGKSIWSVVPDGAAPTPADQQWRTTINFGGGARWFPRHHLSVGFDIRQYAVSLGMAQVGAQAGLPPSPKTTLTVIAAGVSLRYAQPSSGKHPSFQRQLSAISFQPSAISHRPSAICYPLSTAADGLSYEL